MRHVLEELKLTKANNNSRNCCSEIEFIEFCSWSHETISFILKLDIWISHILKKKDLLHCVDICDLLLKREKNDSFLKWIVTGDKK